MVSEARTVAGIGCGAEGIGFGAGESGFGVAAVSDSGDEEEIGIDNEVVIVEIHVGGVML